MRVTLAFLLLITMGAAPWGRAATDPLLATLETSLEDDPTIARIETLLEQVRGRIVVETACVERLSNEERILRAAAAGAPPTGVQARMDALQDELFSCRISQAKLRDWADRLERRLARLRGVDLLERTNRWIADPPSPGVAALLISLLGSLMLGAPARRTREITAAAAVILVLTGLGLGWPAGTLVVIGLVAVGALPALAASQSRWSGLALAIALSGTWLWFGSLQNLPNEARLHWSTWSTSGLVLGALGLGTLGLLSFRVLGGIARWMGMLAALLAGAALGAVGAWRLDLAAYLMQGGIATLLGWFVLSAMRAAVRRRFSSLDPNVAAPDPPSQRSGLIKVAIDIVIVLALVWFLSETWQWERFGIASPTKLLRDGFQIGNFTVAPLNILFALLAYFVLTGLLGRSRRWMVSALAREGVAHERGVELLALVVRYVGLVVAVLVALAIAGVDVTNLALVAGALSLGIGFGLQNVVNNFVSGVILAFERPIRVGDWIRVGSTEGFVKRIRVRSTQIETFDRAEVIVPNSDLIASTVTNLTLSNGIGRLVLPVGVAYGSDVQKLRSILLELVSHDVRIIQDDPPPKVVFVSFGDSSLNFEIRCHLRDVLTTVDVRSDLHFAIEAALREHQIEIPFPQRDVHIRSRGNDA